MNLGYKRDSKYPTDVSFIYKMTIWHWVVVFGTLFAVIIEGLLPHGFGTFIASFRNNDTTKLFIHATQFQLDWLPVLSSSIPFILLPLFSLLVQKFHRLFQLFALAGFVIMSLSCLLSSYILTWPTLFVSYSILYSIGSSLIISVVIIILSEYYPVQHSYHVMATSLYQASYPIAAMVSNPIFSVLLIKYSWSITFKFAALIQLLTGICISITLKPFRSRGLCMKMNEEESEELDMSSDPNQYPATESSTYLDDTSGTLSTSAARSVLCRLQMWPWLFGKYFNYIFWYGFRTNIVTYMNKNTNLGLQKSANLMSFYAAAEITVAFLCSILGGKFRRWLVHIHLFAVISLAIICAVVPLIDKTQSNLIIIMIFIGIFIQLSMSLGYPASIEVMYPERLDHNCTLDVDNKSGWVATSVAAGLGILTSPFLSGLVIDKMNHNTPQAFFWVQTIGWSFQIILFIITLTMMKFNGQRDKSLHDNCNINENGDYHEFKYKD